MKKLIFALVVLIAFSGVTLAGTFPQDTFDDLEDPHFEGLNIENWFSSAAQYWKNRAVIEGIRGNFEAEKFLNRAQFAVLLKRFEDYLKHPKGTEWETIKNEFYSVQYPLNAPESRGSSHIDECETGMLGLGDYVWWIKCLNSEERTPLELIQEEDSNHASQVIETLLINGHESYKVTNVSQDGYMQRYILVDGGDHFYKISGTDEYVDPAFEQFYTSFKVL